MDSKLPAFGIPQVSLVKCDSPWRDLTLNLSSVKQNFLLKSKVDSAFQIIEQEFTYGRKLRRRMVTKHEKLKAEREKVEKQERDQWLRISNLKKSHSFNGKEAIKESMDKEVRFSYRQLNRNLSGDVQTVQEKPISNKQSETVSLADSFRNDYQPYFDDEGYAKRQIKSGIRNLFRSSKLLGYNRRATLKPTEVVIPVVQQPAQKFTYKRLKEGSIIKDLRDSMQMRSQKNLGNSLSKFSTLKESISKEYKEYRKVQQKSQVHQIIVNRKAKSQQRSCSISNLSNFI
ncbi:hypothetical protein FGO68_gene11859 [Halteria grandinella]|uniref:Uncharacterized protein n=1 Tax=Halteria grandinella TaxID=5974 RepID=A0A8J8P3T4_HALGN|nr:hypothetical protein FGO68_gene11859 [Halteria grandinella]